MWRLPSWRNQITARIVTTCFVRTQLRTLSTRLRACSPVVPLRTVLWFRQKSKNATCRTHLPSTTICTTLRLCRRVVFFSLIVLSSLFDVFYFVWYWLIIISGIVFAKCQNLLYSCHFAIMSCWAKQRGVRCAVETSPGRERFVFVILLLFIIIFAKVIGK